MKISEPIFYRRMCDASAAVALDAEHFVVGNDEDNVLRVYHRQKGGGPIQQIDLTQGLRLEPEHPEADLEGVAKLADTVFWITSHGRNQEGKKRPNRQRFFGLRFKGPPGQLQAEWVGQPARGLLSELCAAPGLAEFKLAEAARLPPKAPGGLNIEGLSSTPEGHLLVGFRNPIPRGRALLVPMLNPFEVLEGRPARFGEPVVLDLGGLGIRAMDYHNGQYVIVAGTFSGEGDPRLFLWKGGQSTPLDVSGTGLRGLNPEEIVFYPAWDRPGFQLLSDDGTRKVGGQRCKDLTDPSAKSFRGVWIDLGL